MGVRLFEALSSAKQIASQEFSERKLSVYYSHEIMDLAILISDEFKRNWTDGTHEFDYERQSTWNRS